GPAVGMRVIRKRPVKRSHSIWILCPRSNRASSTSRRDDKHGPRQEAVQSWREAKCDGWQDEHAGEHPPHLVSGAPDCAISSPSFGGPCEADQRRVTVGPGARGACKDHRERGTPRGYACLWRAPSKTPTGVEPVTGSAGRARSTQCGDDRGA